MKRFALTLLLLPAACCFSRLDAQNIKNDTIYVNTTSIVELVFHDPSSAEIPNGDGSYGITAGTGTSLQISAKKKKARTQPMIVTEGGREHKFILVYRDDARPLRLDYSDLDALRSRVEKEEQTSLAVSNEAEARQEPKGKGKRGKRNKEQAAPVETEAALISRVLQEANALYQEEKWEEARVKYEELVPKKFGEKDFVLFRLERIREMLGEQAKKDAAERERKYGDAMSRAAGFRTAKKNREEEAALKEALSFKPGDADATNKLEQVQQKIAQQEKEAEKLKNRQAFAALLKKGDAAMKSGKYEAAKEQYDEAARLDPDDEGLARKLAEVARQLEGKRYKRIVSRGDSLLKAKDYQASLAAYSEALGIRSGDSYVTGQLKKVKAALNAPLQKASYAEAVSNADKAREAREFDRAISEYERAHRIFPDSTYPARQIEAVKRLQKDPAVRQAAEKKASAKTKPG